MLSCSKSSPAPKLVGTWERVSSRKLVVYNDGRAPYDQTDVDPPGNYLWEFAADGQVKIISSGTVGTSTYTYSGENITLSTSRTITGGVWRVTELTDHRLVLDIHQYGHGGASINFIGTFKR
ncbi:hypothetical protein [Hymenobacter glacialis]|uniref:hypothetical protein n=1 Tax=Hymenobacter glacialis TaxID=1908236 RepID=UPI001300D590|nr:hypothetical protein [Hymenobacter glacialis]